MRLWTVHPRYLDPQGLVALWRESLLARAVLRGETKGYRHHPQLQRFREHAAPRSAINSYLASVWAEAESRGYSFDRAKLGRVHSTLPITSTAGQLSHEWQHLLKKLRSRNPIRYRECRDIVRPDPHPLFRIRPGPVEGWERVHGDAQ